MHSIKEAIKRNGKLKSIVHRLIMHPLLVRPRWYIRCLAPLYQHRGKGSVIYGSVRMDTPPFHHFSIGKRSVIESYSCINNAVGDVSIGDDTRIGLHNTVIGPVSIGKHVITAQGVTISALNHNFSDISQPICTQGYNTQEIIIEDDVWIGANCVLTPGVQRCAALYSSGRQSCQGDKNSQVTFVFTSQSCLRTKLKHRQSIRLHDHRYRGTTDIPQKKARNGYGDS